MNNENYEYLKDQLTMTGFSGAVDQLSDQMQKGETGFQLTHQGKYGEKEMNYILNFRQSSKSDMYFFNSYAANLSGGKNDVSTTFYADQRITAKEAFNLLDGRSVEKKYNHHEKIGEGDSATYKPIKDSTYNQWIKLDLNDVDKNGNFKVLTYGEKWGFNLEEQLNKLPLRQLGDEESKLELMASLRKGNIQSVTFEQNGISEARYVEANPRFRTINVYDNKMELIKDQKQARNITGSDDDAKEQKQSEKQEEKPEEDESNKQKRSRSRKVG